MAFCFSALFLNVHITISRCRLIDSIAEKERQRNLLSCTSLLSFSVSFRLCFYLILPFLSHAVVLKSSPSHFIVVFSFPIFLRCRGVCHSFIPSTQPYSFFRLSGSQHALSPASAINRILRNEEIKVGQGRTPSSMLLSKEHLNFLCFSYKMLSMSH